MMVALQCFIVTAFNYSSVCLEVNSSLSRFAIEGIATLTFYLPLCLGLLVFDDIYPLLLKLECCDKLATFRKDIMGCGCIDCFSLIILIIISGPRILLMASIGVFSAIASLLNEKSWMVGVFQICVTVFNIIKPIFIYGIRNCCCCPAHIKNEVAITPNTKPISSDQYQL